MSEWRERPLGDLVTLQRGFDLPARERVPGAYRIMSAGESYDTHNVARVGGPGFVIGRSTNIGLPQWSHGDFWPLNTTLFAKDFHGNDPRWLFHVFETIDLSGYNSGSAQPTLNRNYIASIPIMVPPLATQHAIAEVLGALDDKIAANRRVVELGHDLGTTICKSAEAKPRPLINVADIVMGTSPRGDQLNELGSGVPFFQGVRDFGSVFPSTRVYTSSPQRMATAGSILFSVRAPVGQTNLAVGDVCIGRGLAALHTQEQPATLYFSLKAYPEVWDIYSGGGTVFSSITGKELQQTLVPMPDAFMTSDVELKLSALLKRLVAAARENQILASTRDELLPLLMSGRITVGAASSRVEEVV